MQASPMRTAIFRDMNQLVTDECVTISGVSRRMILLWNRDLAALPDRSFVGGFFFRFVAPRDTEPGAGVVPD